MAKKKAMFLFVKAFEVEYEEKDLDDFKKFSEPSIDNERSFLLLPSDEKGSVTTQLNTVIDKIKEEVL